MPLSLTSRLFDALGVRHGFTLRAGGASEGAYASLNLGRAVGDDAAKVERNWTTLAASLGARVEDFAAAHQVHGDRVLVASRGERGVRFAEALPGTTSAPAPPGSAAEGAGAPPADAVLASDASLAASVRVADCAPLLLVAPRERVVAAVHAGWRGARLCIGARAVRALASTFGADAGEVVAAIGPCIRRCCYEVSDALADEFRAAFGAGAAEGRKLDLPFALRAALVEAGVRGDRIELVGGCTACEPGRYFSHRRDKGTTGRHVAFAFPPDA